MGILVASSMYSTMESTGAGLAHGDNHACKRSTTSSPSPPCFTIHTTAAFETYRSNLCAQSEASGWTAPRPSSCSTA